MKTLRHLLSLAAVLLLAATLLPATGASAAAVYPGAQYREEYFPMGDIASVNEYGANLGGTMLHADLLRDQSYSWAMEQPTVLVVSPYTNHNGSTTDVNLTGGNGPMDRFYDFLDVTGALGEGYTFAQVDLPGNGGSSGCNDWGGPVEQGAVRAAVEWIAEQPWSNGHVALLGKSYDGWTGLMGMAQDSQHEVHGLSAVIAQEPVFSGYRYLYNNGVRFLNSVSTNALFQVVDAKPGAINDDPEYHVNGAPQAYCYGVNMGLQQQDREEVAFWENRNLVRQAAGSDVPLFLTQGFLETNTKVDAALDFWNAIDHSHGENKLWIGQYDHVRGWEQDCSKGWDCEDTSFKMGREDFAEQIMVFLDEHLKGVQPTEDEEFPTVQVQDNLGRWRGEDTYPTADQSMLVTDLATGSYTDGLSGSIISISEPLAHDVWLGGEAILAANVTTTVPRGNLTALVYDVDPTSGRARVIHQGSTLIRNRGASTVTIQMYAQDWVIPAGHRIAVDIHGTGGGFASWVHVPTGQTVTVSSAQIALPFLTQGRTDFQDGYRTARLRGYNTGITAAAASAGTVVPFTLPGPIEIGDLNAGNSPY